MSSDTIFFLALQLTVLTTEVITGYFVLRVCRRVFKRLNVVARVVLTVALMVVALLLTYLGTLIVFMTLWGPWGVFNN